MSKKIEAMVWMIELSIPLSAYYLQQQYSKAKNV